MKYLIFASLFVLFACTNNQKTELPQNQPFKEDPKYNYFYGTFCHSNFVEIDEQKPTPTNPRAFKYMKINQDFNNSIAFEIKFKRNRDSSFIVKSDGYILNFKQVYYEVLKAPQSNVYHDLKVVNELEDIDNDNIDNSKNFRIIRITTSQFLQLLPCESNYQTVRLIRK